VGRVPVRRLRVRRELAISFNTRRDLPAAQLYMYVDLATQISREIGKKRFISGRYLTRMRHFRHD